MASVVTRKHRSGECTYKVQFLLGGRRGAPWQSETFTDRRSALKFAALVDAADQRWPDGWVKGVGFGEAPEPAEEHPLLAFGIAYVRRLTSTGPDTQTKYVQQLTSLNQWLTEIMRVTPTIENMTSDDDRDWIVARRRGGASPKTIANYHGLLAAVFKSAVEKGLIARNPCVGVKLPPVDDDTEDDDDKVFLTEREFALLRDCIRAADRDLLTIAVGTGLRWGELTGLKVKDLDLDGSPASLAVRRAWKSNGRGEFALEQHAGFYLGKPKTRESRRRITLAGPIVDALRRAAAGRGPDELVFPANGGGRLVHGKWYRGWQRAIKAAQLQGLAKTPRFHDLRHSHVAWLISAGVPLPVIQKRLGHKSIKITVDVYGGLLFQTHEVADLAIERALGGDKVVRATRQGGAQAGEPLDEPATA
ncbi:MAG TPA: site-specific integrase [Mycobacteriales bacterium]